MTWFCFPGFHSIVWLLLLKYGDLDLAVCNTEIWNEIIWFILTIAIQFACDFDLILSMVALHSYSIPLRKLVNYDNLFYESLVKILCLHIFETYCSMFNRSMSLSTIWKVQRFIVLSLHQITSMWTQISCSPPEFFIANLIVIKSNFNVSVCCILIYMHKMNNMKMILSVTILHRHKFNLIEKNLLCKISDQLRLY